MTGEKKSLNEAFSVRICNLFVFAAVRQFLGSGLKPQKIR